MKPRRFGLLVAVVLTVGAMPAPGQALPHGCVSISNSYWVSADVARRSVGLAVYTNEPCSFYFSPDDTYSGIGAFIVRCSTGGEANHPNIDIWTGQGMGVVNEPIPQPCDPGARVTIHANKPFQGGAVVAGSPT